MNVYLIYVVQDSESYDHSISAILGILAVNWIVMDVVFFRECILRTLLNTMTLYNNIEGKKLD